MADFEPPSFSLGLDLDFDSEPQITVREGTSSKQQAPHSSINASFRTLEDDDDFEPQSTDPDLLVAEHPPPVLKRLRRGPINEFISRKSERLWCNVDDEIEEFSSQEDLRRDERSSTQYHSVCSSSKFPLHGHRVKTTQSASESKERKRKQASNAPASASLDLSRNKLMLPKLTISPLRRFQLIDSDSDDPSVCEDVPRDANKIDPSSKKKQFNLGENATASERKRTKAPVDMAQTKDLWKDFRPNKGCHIPTPALDEVCEEYFRSVKDKNVALNLGTDVCASNDKGCYQKESVRRSVEHNWDLGDPCPPAHRYFFHENPRIQKLVRSRLPNFFPLGAVNNRGIEQPGASVIDYMSQFSHGEASKQQGTGEINIEKSSTRGRKNSKNPSAGEVSHASGSWVNPRHTASIPKNASKRRVHADGRSSGRWYTASDGRRVYVSKSGQGLTGRTAYGHYKKENGARSRKSKKKTTAKKK